MTNRAFWFAGGDTGEFRVLRMTAVRGAPIAEVARVTYRDAPSVPQELAARWVYRGVTSNLRYTTRPEKTVLAAQPNELGSRRRAALVLIKKNDAWWELTQDERRAVFEDQSQHIAKSLRYVPAIARKLHHCRDLGTEEPFDFLTWFEFQPKDEPTFDELVATLRASEEWRYVEREVDMRLARE
jgi:hypothetical protein